MTWCSVLLSTVSAAKYDSILCAVFGYTDGSGRFWSVPVDWADVQHRIMLPYPHGYQVRRT